MIYSNSPLGKQSAYIDQYTPTLLFPIARKTKRDEIGVRNPAPFFGYDLWNAYEISWLNTQGKPIVATAEIIVPAESTYIFESKSLKLYFNSFNQSHFDHAQTVENRIAKDLSVITQAEVVVHLTPVFAASNEHFEKLSGFCLDDLEIAIEFYSPQPELLSTDHSVITTETLHSHLLKSNCLVTHQPDWGSIEINYTGGKINHENLLKYFISLRNHNEFHEQCVERIFMTILKYCRPTELTVYARYTRRGGIDINPYRSTRAVFSITNPRLIRQ